MNLLLYLSVSRTSRCHEANWAKLRHLRLDQDRRIKPAAHVRHPNRGRICVRGEVKLQPKEGHKGLEVCDLGSIPQCCLIHPSKSLSALVARMVRTWRQLYSVKVSQVQPVRPLVSGGNPDNYPRLRSRAGHDTECWAQVRQDSDC